MGHLSDQAHPNARVGRQRYQPEAGRSEDGGAWRGPTDAAWMTRLLRGALPPRPSTGEPAPALVSLPAPVLVPLPAPVLVPLPVEVAG